MKNNIQGLLFSLQNEYFGISVENVLRVINLEKLIKIPKAPDFVSGAINLEGNVIELGETRLSEKSKVVILEVDHGEEYIQVGILIDEVLDVVSISSAEMQAPPMENMGFDTHTLDGMYRKDDTFYMILNAKKIFEKDLVEVVQ